MELIPYPYHDMPSFQIHSHVQRKFDHYIPTRTMLQVGLVSEIQILQIHTELAYHNNTVIDAS